MKNQSLFSRSIVVFAIGVCPLIKVQASGFGLYSMSSKTHAMSGAVVGKAVDASANFYNPATLSDITNVAVTVGVVTEHPRARMKVDGNASSPMDPGLFWLPHFNLAVPLPFDFTFGLGCWPEFGLGSAYDDNWELVASSQETTVQSFTLNPNLSYAITEKWSVGAGLRVLFFDFEQYSDPLPGKVGHRLKGDNRMSDMGWQIGTRYKVLDNLSLGLVYKSKINANIEGTSDKSGLVESRVKAETNMDLPQSISGGFNWDITDTWHLGGAVMWTEWRSVDQLDFNLGGTHVPCNFNWKDTFRYAVAPSWDFIEDWTWMASYAFETDCTADQDSTMLPGAERHMLATGFSWQCLESLELALSYGLVLMEGKTSQATVNGVEHKYKPYRGLSHAVGFSITYRF